MVKYPLNGNNYPLDNYPEYIHYNTWWYIHNLSIIYIYIRINIFDDRYNIMG